MVRSHYADFGPTLATEALLERHVSIYDHIDGMLEIPTKGRSLPCGVFAKGQRVTQTAVVENECNELKQSRQAVVRYRPS